MNLIRVEVEELYKLFNDRPIKIDDYHSAIIWMSTFCAIKKLYDSQEASGCLSLTAIESNVVKSTILQALAQGLMGYSAYALICVIEKLGNLKEPSDT